MRQHVGPRLSPARLTIDERLEALRLVGDGLIGLERALEAVLRIERERRALAAELATLHHELSDVASRAEHARSLR